MTEQSETRACSIQGCPGTYEVRRVVHTVRHQGDIIVVEDVPAEVCSVCGDVLFTPETVEHVQRIVRERKEPARRHAPVYSYA
ncbi:MAG: YgiT-type zinc finger protein [Bacteroidetes bacterium]|jgi:YgiT-type zinc finger domain-containing protein|nr:YgiT-type zinc finger protein [Bacteroidota bacterium]